MLGKDHISLGRIAMSRFIDILDLSIGVPHLGTADRVDLVQIMGGIFGQVEALRPG
jgi:hypothetical protein